MKTSKVIRKVLACASLCLLLALATAPIGGVKAAGVDSGVNVTYVAKGLRESAETAAKEAARSTPGNALVRYGQEMPPYP